MAALLGACSPSLEPEAGGGAGAGGAEVGHNPAVWPTDSSVRATITAIAVAPTGDIYVAGTYFGAADFGSGPLPPGSGPAFVAGFEPNGNPIWSQPVDGTEIAIAVSDGGQLVIATTQEDGYRICTTDDSGDVHVRALEPASGAVRWERTLSWTGGGTGLAVAAADGVTVAMPGRVVRLNGDGEELGATPLELVEPKQLVTAPGGGVVLEGVRAVTCGPLVEHHQVVALEASGAVSWRLDVESNWLSHVGVATNDAGDTAVTGWFTPTVTIGNGAPLATNEPDARFVVRVDPGGRLVAAWVLEDFSLARIDSITWRGDEVVMAGTDGLGVALNLLDATGAVSRLATVDTGQSGGGLVAVQGPHLIVAGPLTATNIADCVANCPPPPKPFIWRTLADGSVDPDFGALDP